MAEDIITVSNQPDPQVIVDSPPADNVVTDEAPENQAADTDGSGKTDQTPPWLKAEITKERNRRRAAEERQAALEAQLADLSRALADKAEKPQQREEPSADRPQRPRREDYFTPEEYDRAFDHYEEQLVDWQASVAESRVEAKMAERAREQARIAETQRVQQAWNERVAEAKKEYPDFEAVVYSDDFQCSEPMMNAMVADANGAKVAYHLATNPDEAARIATLQPIAQAIEIGRLSATLNAPSRVSKAPPPIEPLGNAAPALDKSPAHESDAEYFARRAAEVRAKRERLY